jgi:hypothetical protein
MPGPRRFSGFPNGSGCRNSRSKAVAAADWSDLQVQAGMFRMAAFIQDLEVGLVGRPDADEHVRLFMVFTEVTTETALSALNCFHVLTSR